MKTRNLICLLMVLVIITGLVGCGAGAPPSASYAGEDASGCQGDVAAVQPDDEWRNVEMDPEEEYDNSPETPFKNVETSPLSTFSADVDTASYSNMRRFINNGQRPEGVRIEELVNYFDYSYPRPEADAEHPFTITAEVAPCPWNAQNQLAMIGIQGAELENSGDIANNIVFLLDVSGSMNEANKLPLLQESFILLLENLGSNDVVSIVTYAGSDRVIADGISGEKHNELKRKINNLTAGGSTAGAKGLETAYALANKHYIEGGNNRIIMATDGDFNVGQSSTAALQAMVERERESGVFISVLGFGMYNLNDNMMETIADWGNGNYAYIDTIREARKVLVDEFDATMFVIAKDLKIQVEFNPAVVAQYRLIGYNNRRLEDEDFNDDAKDAGDVGAGHSVTAFYELVLVGAEGEANVDDLLYQQSQPTGSEDYFTVKVRYKEPDGTESKLVSQAVTGANYSESMSENFAFSSAVVEFGLILIDSQYRADSNLNSVLERAGENIGEDPFELRYEFVDLVEEYKRIID